MPRGFVVKNGVLKPAACHPYVRPWADDDDDDDARCHGDDTASSSDVTAHTRRPFSVISSKFDTALPSTCAASNTGIRVNSDIEKLLSLTVRWYRDNAVGLQCKK